MAIMSVNSINLLVFVKDTQCVPRGLCAICRPFIGSLLNTNTPFQDVFFSGTAEM